MSLTFLSLVDQSPSLFLSQLLFCNEQFGCFVLLQIDLPFLTSPLTAGLGCIWSHTWLSVS